MELVNCTEQYWEFVRMLRTHPLNKYSFFTQIDIDYKSQIEYMRNNAYRYKICLIENNPVGYIGIIKDNEITYCVHPDYKSMGIGKFMVSELMKNTDLLTAFVLPENIASNKVFEKLGFRKQIYYVYDKNYKK